MKSLIKEVSKNSCL